MTIGFFVSGGFVAGCAVLICDPLPMTDWQYTGAICLALWVGGLLGIITDKVQNRG